jgi:LEA14-like dessication related protein
MRTRHRLSATFSSMVASIVLTANCAHSAGLLADLLPPAISIAGIHSPALSAEGVQLICSVRVENPNAVALAVQAADIQLQLANTPAANGRLPAAVVISPREAKQVDVLVSVTLAAAATWLPQFLGTSEFSMPYDVAGYVLVNNPDLGRVPFHETGTVAMVDGELVVQPTLHAQL